MRFHTQCHCLAHAENVKMPDLKSYGLCLHGHHRVSPGAALLLPPHDADGE